MPEPGSVPMIRYATTTDGVSVAWQSVGSGPALVWMPSLGNLVAQWRIPFLRRAYEALAGSLQLVPLRRTGHGQLQPSGRSRRPRRRRAAARPGRRGGGGRAGALRRARLLPLGAGGAGPRGRPSGPGHSDGPLRRLGADAGRHEPQPD